MSRFLCLLLFLSLLIACGKIERRLRNLPVVISRSESQGIDIDLIISNAQEEVQNFLPNAYLVFFSFIGKCANLPELEGEVRIDFAQIYENPFENKTFLAETTVHTSTQTLNLDIRDETEHYPNIEPLILTGKTIPEIASILHAYLESTNTCTDTVVLTRVRTEIPWRARLGPPEEGLLESIEIDPESGKVTELR